ncbi:MAG: L-threonine dehydratase [Chloroflexota bacterium]|nr:MAG: L-threonine dehydratase [Chloroflexota bacterium]
MQKLIDLAHIRSTTRKIRGIVKKTPLQESLNYSQKYNSKIFFKREDLQDVKSFKIRGAYTKILSVEKTIAQNGLVCASAGNHAQGFAVSCSLLDYNGTVFMPHSTPSLKVSLVKKFGGKNIKIKLVGENFSKAYKAAMDYCIRNRKTFIHPFDDIKVIEGQATLFLEVIDQIKNPIDYIFIPIGGGGLISGAINIFKQLSPKTKIIGIEPAGAPSMKESIIKNKIIKLNKIDNFVDGAAVHKIGIIPFEFCKDYLDDLLVIDEGEICQSILDLKSIEKINAEPAGAMSSAALRLYKEKIVKKNVVCIICGGNNDDSRMKEIYKRAINWKNLSK